MGDEGLLCGVKLHVRGVARGTHAGSVVRKNWCPSHGVIGGERERRSRAPGTLFVPQIAEPVKPLSGTRDIKTSGV